MNSTTMLATTLCASLGATVLAAPPPMYDIDSVSTWTATWAEASDFPLDLYDQKDDVQSLFWFALADLNSVSWANADTAIGNGSSHCSAAENENSFQIFGDSHAYYGIDDDQWAKGVGQASTYVEFTLDWNCKVSGQFCVRGDDSGGGAASAVGLYPIDEPENLLVFITLDDGDDCRNFDLILPPGKYLVRAYCDALADSAMVADPGGNSWSQFGAEVIFDGIADPDIDDNGVVDGVDLGRFLAMWGSNNPDFDFNGDGVVDGQDLAILLANWG